MDMNRGFPSKTALLGLLAVAGYRNRHKIAKFLGDLGQSQRLPDGNPQRNQAGGFLDILRQFGQNFGGHDVDRTRPGGMSSGPPARLTDHSGQSGQAYSAGSWVGHGPNRAATSAELERTIDPEGLDALSKQTGLSRQELLTRLSRDLPESGDI